MDLVGDLNLRNQMTSDLPSHLCRTALCDRALPAGHFCWYLRRMHFASR